MKKGLFILSTALLFACGNVAEKPQGGSATDSTSSTASKEHTPATVKVDISANKLNQTARIIAGIVDERDGDFSHITSDTTWTNYAAESKKQWEGYHAKNAKLYEWVKGEILPTTSSLNEIFYPFSGPDFLYGNLIFPDSRNIYMFGLEEIGTVPDFSKINAEELENYIAFYKKSIGEVLSYSFYRTLGMKEYLHNDNIDGVTPVLMLFMAQSGKQISEINKVTLNEDGAIRVVGDGEDFMALENRGVELKYFNGEDDVERRLVFFTGNVADGALAENTALKNYYQALRPEGVLTKSATYLMHKTYFSTIRNAILKNSNVIVSDDSGIAYRFYNPKTWDVRLYGTYTRPIELFDEHFEEGLLEAYENGKGIKPLNFRIGYSYPSNMRMAIRK